MRDNNEGMIEIIDAFKEGEDYFAIIEVTKNKLRQKFRFGITLLGYSSIKIILQSRPLGMMVGMQYKYFWSGTIGKSEKDHYASIDVRCEVLDKAKSFSFDIAENLVANLRWFKDLESFNDAEELLLEKTFENAELINTLRQGAIIWNKWRAEQEAITAGAINLDLTNVSFSGIKLSGANLSGAMFDAADLSHADLSNANLQKADFFNTDLSNTNLSSANLTDADLQFAKIENTNFTDAIGVDLSKPNNSSKNM